ncbi:ATP-binding protein [Peribacillus tepidiphilus]|uniref:ATP-binding protein n=1 Tax=Peribacillus tepidiphilus TaxID=2652445 RepID=UPI0035B55370
MLQKALLFLKYHLSLIYSLLFFFMMFAILVIVLQLSNLHVTDHSLYVFLLIYFVYSSFCLYVIVSYFREKEIIRRNMEREIRYKKLIDQHPDGIVMHEKGRIIYANSVALNLVGYHENEVIGKTLLDFTHPSGHERILKRQKDIYSSTEEIMLDLCEYELITKNGSSCFVESKAIVCQFNDKRCVQLVLRDITERKKQEERLKVSDKLAVVGQIAAGIAHEIRNPLTSIKGFIQIMRESSQNPFYYDVIMDEIDRINQVTNDFLILAKPHAQDFRLDDFTKILDDVVHLLQPEALLHNVEFIFQPMNDKHFLLCDRNELKQVFINIFKNSIEAMPNGGQIKLNCSPNNDRLRVTIEDTGIGIPKNQLPNIGQPFYTLKEKGTGLGLMTTMKIIEKHKGTFDIESMEGRGTIVTIEFPLEKLDNLSEEKSVVEDQIA